MPYPNRYLTAGLTTPTVARAAHTARSFGHTLIFQHTYDFLETGNSLTVSECRPHCTRRERLA
jgi:hypothetical protein